MSDLDPQREWKRLSELYGRMSDEELLRIAADRRDLTALATEVLNAEMRGRGLAMPNQQTPESRSESTEHSVEDVIEFENALDAPADLVEVAQFRFPSEGALAKAALESADIQTWAFDGTMAKYVGVGVRLCVKPEDVEAAKDILTQPIPESFEVEGVGTFEQPRCPKCNSLDISYGTAIYDGMVDRELLPDEHWWCHKCGVRWEEEDESTAGEQEKEEPQR